VGVEALDAEVREAGGEGVRQRGKWFEGRFASRKDLEVDQALIDVDVRAKSVDEGPGVHRPDVLTRS
jgi:hypothetical protein